MTSGDSDRSDLLERALIEVAVDTWRLSRLLVRVATKLDAGDQPRYMHQVLYVNKKLEEQLAAAGFTLVSVEGQLFDPGMAASALNISDFGADERLLVEQMVEPIIMGSNGLRRQGTMVLRKAHG